MNLTIDVGNTQFKICVFENNKMIHSFFSNELNHELYQKELAHHSIERCIFSSTRIISKEEIQKFIPLNIELIELKQDTALPITINYSTPDTLGKDRIAAAVGAQQLFPKNPVLIIDIGTAITIDFLDQKGIYHGGVISPGPETRYRSLNEFTGKLPLLDPEVIPEGLQGKSTNEAIHLGVQNGICFEINEYILRYNKQYDDLKVVITGGYTYLFDKKINYPIFAELFIVPLGLNRILEYNDN